MEERIKYLWDYLSSELFSLPGEHGSKPLFNPYFGLEPGLDQAEADRIRRENLRSYFTSFSQLPGTLVVGEAPGWRGCRFSGIPFTSESQLLSGELPFGGGISSKSGRLHREASATIFWKVMHPYYPHFLAWNCLPLHPYKPGLPASNRHASTRETVPFDPILRKLIKILEPEGILAVGKDAQMSLTRLSFDHTPVRHPSHGGVKTFGDGVEEFFRKMGIFPS
jgi:uracil-DNA glycosylase